MAVRIYEFDEPVTESNAIENWPGPCPNGCPIPDAKVKALAKTKTLDPGHQKEATA
jgi:hypothetical protein